MIRIGIIGIGNMGREHIRNIMDGKIPHGKLTAACDIREDRLAWLDGQGLTEVKKYLTAEELCKSGEVDLIIIAVPHYFHPPIAETAFKCGINVITEKPAGVYTKQVREMNEAAQKTDKIFGIMYNQRTNPVYQKARELIKNGELGELKRIVWIVTSWYRPQAYHDSSDWRSRWATEGGGVLINQCPHQLDLLQWIPDKMPKRLRSFVGFGKYHDIEVDDDVTAYFEYDNGATGLFVTCTAEAPGTNRLEISGDRGKLVIEDEKMQFYRLTCSEREFNKTSKECFAMPEVWKVDIPISTEIPGHAGILNNVVSAIENGTELLAPGEEGIKGLTISNAIHLSAWTDSWIDLDNIDEDLYLKLLNERIENSTMTKNLRENVVDTRNTH